MKTIKQLEEEMKNIDKKYGNRTDEFLIAHRLDERIETLKDVLKLIDEWKKENNKVLTTSKLKKDKVIIADYVKRDKIYELKKKISGGEK